MIMKNNIQTKIFGEKQSITSNIKVEAVEMLKDVRKL